MGYKWAINGLYMGYMGYTWAIWAIWAICTTVGLVVLVRPATRISIVLSSLKND